MRTASTTIRARLLILAVLSGLLVVILLVTTQLSERKIGRAYNSIDATQKTIQSAQAQIDTAILLKETINRIQKRVLELRTLEKTYLQFRRPELKQRFDSIAEDLGGMLDKLSLVETKDKFSDYRKTFAEQVDLQLRQSELNRKMTEPLKISEERLSSIFRAPDLNGKRIQ